MYNFSENTVSTSLVVELDFQTTINALLQPFVLHILALRRPILTPPYAVIRNLEGLELPRKVDPAGLRS